MNNTQKNLIAKKYGDQNKMELGQDCSGFGYSNNHKHNQFYITGYGLV